MSDSAPAELARLTDRLALSTEEAAEALGISEGTLRKWMREFDLPCVRLDRVVRLPVEGLRAWLRERAKAEKGRVEAVVDDVLQSIRESGND